MSLLNWNNIDKRLYFCLTYIFICIYNSHTNKQIIKSYPFVGFSGHYQISGLCDDEILKGESYDIYRSF